MMIDKLAFSQYWQRQGRWPEVEAFKNQAIRDARASGLRGEAARDAGWHAAIEAFQLPSSADPVPPPPAMEQQHDDEAVWIAAKDWAADWFGCIRELARWQVKHGVSMTDDALRELLEDILGFGIAWAWFQGANGNQPQDSTDKDNGQIADAIHDYFGEAAAVLLVEDLPELAAESPPLGD
jgi:hypothetical protein